MQPDLLHIASVSGGKDSVAMCLWLTEQGIEHRRVFMDTGWEHPDLYAHLDYLEGVLGPIERIHPPMPDLPADVLADVEAIEALVGVSPSGFVRWAAHKGMFPSRRRYCTQELKVRPFLQWVDALDADVVNVVGIRAEESAARAKLPERELMPGAEHIEVWRPLLTWTEEQVIKIHQRHGVVPCPLYLRGSTRVGCWPCIQSNKSELAQLVDDARRVMAIRLLEELVGRLAAERAATEKARKKAGSLLLTLQQRIEVARARVATLPAFHPATEDGERRRDDALEALDRLLQQEPALAARADGCLLNPPTLYQSPLRSAAGERPCWPIDDILTWARTEHGGRTMSLDPSWGREAGCVRWGMCDHRPDEGGW